MAVVVESEKGIKIVDRCDIKRDGDVLKSL